ncbi:GntR family transcriptional regulator [Enterovirga rhinocerotis]|uniref:GntR family transcriptional regulator n=1 Tax=Enterovirga rhinocerotis TaxID=1339210 RepID=A0A4R7C5E1_9HYPH|nr:GntR family transcriptional regulator [Enterovirga rhinocerotis]TDR93273.1 GntR family transcriptional regulator [Enterovirga rhinocerotis]
MNGDQGTGNLREQVLQRVRAEIIAGESPPGTMYTAPTLAAALGVSSTPAREALLELARGGLLEPVRNRGFRVKEPTLQALRDVFDLREILELHAARIVALKSRKDLSALGALADEIRSAVEADDVRRYLEADRAYHRILLEAAGNTALTDTVMGLRDTMRLYGIRSRAGQLRQIESIAEHYEIISLAEAGEADRLEALMRRHIRSWEPIFVDALTQTGAQLPRS